MTAENKRLTEANKRRRDWKLWGCYLSERAWGTVREDYSADGSFWEYFPFEHSHLKAYRWNEDGIAGICDRRQNVCFAVSFWNEKDRVLKERFFGLSGNEGNHGEDVKEYYYYLDNTPTHSYMKFLYKYPHAAFPYELLLEENKKRGRRDSEFELFDTGIFEDDNYFDIFIEYAKAAPEDVSIKITAVNRGKNKAPIHILPTVWFRNRWSWFKNPEKPSLEQAEFEPQKTSSIKISDAETGIYTLYCHNADELLFTENNSNFLKLYNAENETDYVKDGINEFLVEKNPGAVNPQKKGTKAAAHYSLEIEPGAFETIYLRLIKTPENKKTPKRFISANFAKECERVIGKRKIEADEFYKKIIPPNLNDDAKNVMRQALAGMLWSKQFYHYAVEQWLEGDETFPAPPRQRTDGRNRNWKHLHNDEVLSMPDKWEYPWYAAWDTAFHCIPLALLDPEFAKRQLLLLLREWYMHPNGQIPAYEINFSDVNPPVHAWAALRVYKIEAKNTGRADRRFLEKVFHKLLLNFTWWVNRKDTEGNNVFEGGFLGLDNIGVFDRSAKLPRGGHIEQSDGTSWMAMFCLNMLAIALELARENKVYEDVASKFFEHFIYISDAMNSIGEENTKLWNERDGFYYDVLHLENQRNIPLKIRSMVGLIPLFAVETIEKDLLEELPDFTERLEWFLTNRPELTEEISCMQRTGTNDRRILALVNEDRLRKILRYAFSENEFLSDFGIRSLSRFHKSNPYIFKAFGEKRTVKYDPGESKSDMFGGNSNWRGPIWFPLNYLLIESLQKFDYFYGDNFKTEFPTGSGNMLTLWQISQEIEQRLAKIFLKDEDGNRPFYGASGKQQTSENWGDLLLFYEYFHGDHARGLGASHQTGWTGLIAKIFQQLGEYSNNETT